MKPNGRRYAMFGDYENEPIKINESMNDVTNLQYPLNRQIARYTLLAFRAFISDY